MCSALKTALGFAASCCAQQSVQCPIPHDHAFHSDGLAQRQPTKPATNIPKVALDVGVSNGIWTVKVCVSLRWGLLRSHAEKKKIAADL